ncbi:MAG: spore coat associated protein CotJA [Clostridia bacterium]|nr:spore coat associated protein CotJA [Clostridia bacterium]
MFPKNVMYGHSYVPNQVLNKVFTPKIGLKMGTIFPELVSPYSPCQSMEVNNFLKCANDVKGGCNQDG